MTEKYYDTEAYLKQFTPRQRLEAVISVYQSNGITIVPIEMIRTGFDLAQPDGWQLVAPAWMESFEADGIKPLEVFRND